MKTPKLALLHGGPLDGQIHRLRVPVHPPEIVWPILFKSIPPGTTFDPAVARYRRVNDHEVECADYVFQRREVGGLENEKEKPAAPLVLPASPRRLP